MNDFAPDETRLSLGMAIAVEGRDDVDAVSRACDALIIPTHGFGISERTWELLEKAYRETGLIILTDPDHAGEDIRRRLTERFPESVQCYMAREDAVRGDDIGIENAAPAAIRDALIRALELHRAAHDDTSCEASDSHSGRADQGCVHDNDGNTDSYREVGMRELTDLGLAGTDGAAELRNAVSRELGIGHCNAGSLIKRLRHFRIGYDELSRAVESCTGENADVMPDS